MYNVQSAGPNTELILGVGLDVLSELCLSVKAQVDSSRQGRLKPMWSISIIDPDIYMYAN